MPPTMPATAAELVPDGSSWRGTVLALVAGTSPALAAVWTVAVSLWSATSGASGTLDAAPTTAKSVMATTASPSPASVTVDVTVRSPVVSVSRVMVHPRGTGRRVPQVGTRLR